MRDKKTSNFWRKNAYYVVIAVCAAAIVVMSTFAIINLSNKKPIDDSGIIQTPDDSSKKPDDDSGDNKQPDIPVNTEVIFRMPVENVNIIKSSTTLAVPVMFDETLQQYSEHIAIDFGGAAGDSVFAVYDGVVESNFYDLQLGTIITIDHGDGLKTVYKSLAEQGSLKAGDTVKAGTKIGEMSTSFRLEQDQGVHLHFEVHEKGVAVNPEKYLIFEEK